MCEKRAAPPPPPSPPRIARKQALRKDLAVKAIASDPGRTSDPMALSTTVAAMAGQSRPRSRARVRYTSLGTPAGRSGNACGARHRTRTRVCGAPAAGTYTASNARAVLRGVRARGRMCASYRATNGRTLPPAALAGARGSTRPQARPEERRTDPTATGLTGRRPRQHRPPTPFDRHVR